MAASYPRELLPATKRVNAVPAGRSNRQKGDIGVENPLVLFRDFPKVGGRGVGHGDVIGGQLTTRRWGEYQWGRGRGKLGNVGGQSVGAEGQGG